MTLYSDLGLDRTVRVHPTGAVERDVEVKHDAANVACNMELGTVVIDDEEWVKRCKSRVNHATPKGVEPHVPVDIRLLAAPPYAAHQRRFAPNLIPAGVDMNITLPHDCENHLD